MTILKGLFSLDVSAWKIPSKWLLQVGTFIPFMFLTLKKGISIGIGVTVWASGVTSQTPRAVKINRACKKILLYTETKIFPPYNFYPLV